MSYRKKHLKSKIHSLKPKRSILLKPYFWLMIFIVLLLSGLMYFFFFSSYFQIRNISILQAQKTDTKALERFISERAEYKMLNIAFLHINSKSIFLVNKKDITEDVLNNFTGIEKVNLNKDLPNSLIITVTERKPVGSFCIDSSCYLVDDNGILFEESHAPEAGTIIRQDGAIGTLALGQHVLSAEIVLDIYKIQRILKETSAIDAREALIFDSGRLNITTSEGWKIYFNLNEHIEDQLVKLNAILMGGISDSSKANLYYIDLRPEDRAIVCDNNICAVNL